MACTGGAARSQVWVPTAPVAPFTAATEQNCRGGLFPFLLQDFPEIPALVCPLLKGNSGQAPVPLPGLAHRVQKSQPSPGEGVHGLCFHP